MTQSSHIAQTASLARESIEAKDRLVRQNRFYQHALIAMATLLVLLVFVLSDQKGYAVSLHYLKSGVKYQVDEVVGERYCLVRVVGVHADWRQLLDLSGTSLRLHKGQIFRIDREDGHAILSYE